jgi:hypothetical protein
LESKERNRKEAKNKKNKKIGKGKRKNTTNWDDHAEPYRAGVGV